MSLKVQLVYLGFLLVLSGFFSGSEVALVSLGRLKIRQMLEKKRKGIIFVKKLKDDLYDETRTMRAYCPHDNMESGFGWRECKDCGEGWSRGI